MAAKSIAMQQLQQVLTLYREGQKIKAIARLTGLSRNTVRSYLSRASEDVYTTKQTDGALVYIFYNQDITAYKGKRYQQLVKHFEGSDWELSLPGVTRQLL